MAESLRDNTKLLDYIDKSWDELRVDIAEDSNTHIGLPHPFVAPSVHRTDGFVFREQFYWDTYFTVLALFESGKTELAQGMIDNLLFLLKKLGYVPNSNNRAHLGRSQPPLLSSMVILAYKHNDDEEWLAEAYDLLRDEYYNVWLGKNRLTQTGLSRYYNDNETHRGAEDESGWDYTTRFNSAALDFLPVDLNSLLYLYETNFVDICKELNYEQESIKWQIKADATKELINDVFWDDEKGLYFDQNYLTSEKSRVASLAAFLPLFVRAATEEQAQAVVSNLDVFSTEHGLTTTAKNDEKCDGVQWASPNGWAPLHYFVVEGLKRYSYARQADEVAQKWVNTVVDKFEMTGELYEKYNMINPDKNPAHAVYPDQQGFAWTNAVTYLFIQDTQ